MKTEHTTKQTCSQTFFPSDKRTRTDLLRIILFIKERKRYKCTNDYATGIYVSIIKKIYLVDTCMCE